MKILTSKEIITISGGKNCSRENNCWCAHSQPTDKTYTDGECVGFTANEDACQLDCAEAKYEWATYDLTGFEEADDSKYIIHTLSGFEAAKNDL